MSTIEVDQAQEHLEPADEAKRLGLPRACRRGEAHADYLVALAKAEGVLAHEATLDEPARKRYAEKMLANAQTDEFYGNSRVGQLILNAHDHWTACNPEVQLLGDVREYNRDQRGVPRLIGVLLAEIRDDPSRAERLTAVEYELISTWKSSSKVADAIDGIATARKRALQDVADAVAEAAPNYPMPEPLAPEPEPVPLGRTSQLRRSSLAPVLTAADLHSEFPRSR